MRIRVKLKTTFHSKFLNSRETFTLNWIRNITKRIFFFKHRTSFFFEWEGSGRVINRFYKNGVGQPIFFADKWNFKFSTYELSNCPSGWKLSVHQWKQRKKWVFNLLMRKKRQWKNSAKPWDSPYILKTGSIQGMTPCCSDPTVQHSMVSRHLVSKPCHFNHSPENKNMLKLSYFHNKLLNFY